MLLLMSFISGLIFWFSMEGMAALTSVHYQDVLENANGKVEGMLNKVEVSTVNNLAEIQENLGSPEEVFDAMEKELDLNFHIVGYGVGFVPNYFPEEGYWFEPYVARRDSVRVFVGDAEQSDDLTLLAIRYRQV